MLDRNRACAAIAVQAPVGGSRSTICSRSCPICATRRRRRLRRFRRGVGLGFTPFDVFALLWNLFSFGLFALPLSGAGRMIAGAWGRLQPFDALGLLWNLFCFVVYLLCPCPGRDSLSLLLQRK